MSEKRVKVQNILWPQAGICPIEAMYFRRDGKCYRNKEYYEMEAHSRIFADTYFNSVSIDKWKKYTILEKLYLKLYVKGKLRISLQCKEQINDEIYLKVLSNEIVEASELKEINIQFPTAAKGLACFELEALEDDCQFAGGSYYTIVDENQLRPIKLAIAICTFKRESYIYHNLEILKKYLIENKQADLYKNLEVYVSDNGKTLDPNRVPSENIHIFPNKNAGGAAGFTRDMIEVMNANKNGDTITHIILMDDDIIIEPEAIEKTARILSLLKEDYKEAFIGGAMLRNDRQNIQVESGAFWNGGHMISLKSGLDMVQVSACLYNELEEAREYNAWWYCCVPMTVVREDNLPMPIFIRGDDVEYGLRNTKTLILMNGICVWHEAFDNKYSSYLYYYILRNQLIDNSLHYPNYSKEDLKKELWGKAAREIMCYRYENVKLLIRGVHDYLRGIDWLLHTDGEKLHKNTLDHGYKAKPLEELPTQFFYGKYKDSFIENDRGLKKYLRLLTLNGCLLPAKRNAVVSMSHVRPYNAYRAKTILFYDAASNKGFIVEKSIIEMFKCIFSLLYINKEIDDRYEETKKEYQQRHKELQNIEFWARYLGLKGKRND